MGLRYVVLDTVDVSFINSVGVRALAEAVARYREAGGDLKLVGLNRRVQRILWIIGLERFFSPYETLMVALTDC